MHLETLKIFCEVVRRQSFSKGAEANHVSQSAASQAIRQLEKRLETQLIDRSKRPWALTANGQRFYDGCREIVERYDELENLMRPRQGPPTCTVRVAAIYSVGFHDMKEYEEKFRLLVPGSDIDLQYMHPAEVYKRVLNDQADLGLISFAQRGRELKAVPWRSETMVLACSPSHPLARERELEPRMLSGERFVSFERRLPIRRAVSRFLKEHGVEVELVAVFDNIETIKQAVEEGTGIAILPEPTLRREVERRALVAVPFRGTPFERPLSVILRRGRRHHPAVAEFLGLLCPDAARDDGNGDNGEAAGGLHGDNGATASGGNRGAAGRSGAAGRGENAARNGRRAGAGSRNGTRRRVRSGHEHQQ
jgi:DNA-binding transcriptional LysR family regulator